jgi:hypothetical protein
MIPNYTKITDPAFPKILITPMLKFYSFFAQLNRKQT